MNILPDIRWAVTILHSIDATIYSNLKTRETSAAYLLGGKVHIAHPDVLQGLMYALVGHQNLNCAWVNTLNKVKVFRGELLQTHGRRAPKSCVKVANAAELLDEARSKGDSCWFGIKSVVAHVYTNSRRSPTRFWFARQLLAKLWCANRVSLHLIIRLFRTPLKSQ